MSPEERQHLIEAIGVTIADEVEREVTRRLEPIEKELGRLRLELEHAVLRTREYRFAGVWSDRATYKQGNTVQHQGSTWHCNCDDLKTMPGTDYVGWTLQAKRGADAPGARS